MLRAVIDACVLYNRLQRDILLCLATLEWYELAISHEILHEFQRMTSEKQGKNRSEKLTNRLIEYFPHSFVMRADYESSLEKLKYVNAKDRHVAALAVHVQPSYVITVDKKFQRELKLEGIPNLQPDEFVNEFLVAEGERCIPAFKIAKELHDRSKSVPMTADEFVGLLDSNCLKTTAKKLAQFKNVF